MAKDLTQFGRGEANIQGHDDRASLRSAEITFEQPVSIETQEGDAVGRTDSGGLEGGRKPLASLTKGRIGEALRSANDAFFAAVEIDCAMKASQRCQWNFHFEFWPGPPHSTARRRGRPPLRGFPLL